MTVPNEIRSEETPRDFRERCIALSRRRALPRLLYATDETDTRGTFRLCAVFSAPGEDRFEMPCCHIPASAPRYDSLTAEIPAFHWYEREIRDLFGLIPEGHPDPRPLSLHGCYPREAFHPLRRTADSAALRAATQPDRPDDYDYVRVEGEGVYEIPVGPVHAGIIEPGHFRFSAVGETIYFLDPRLFYVHKGIEKHFEALDYEAGVRLAERVSGVGGVSHATAYCLAAERAAGFQATEAVMAGRTVLVELERLYNHIGDIGNLCAGTGFAVGYARGAMLKEDLQALNARLTGSRFLRGVLTPGGLHLNVAAAADDLRRTLDTAREDFGRYMDFLTSEVGHMDRVQTTGRLSREIALRLGATGVSARASGIGDDLRVAHPHLAYERVAIEAATRAGGDVWARMMLRADEAECSFSIVESLLEKPPGPTPPGAAARRVVPEPGTEALGYTEGPRGSVFYVVRGGPGGRPARVKVRGASFCNWPLMPFAVHGNIVPDFPLINKSFNLSYSGCDG